MVFLTASLTTSAQRLADYRWEKRILLIFGEDKYAALAAKQKEILLAQSKGLEERDLQIFVNPEPRSMRELHNQTGFEVVLVGKDGGVKKRKTELLTPEELFDIIDAMPMRQGEVRKN